MRIWTEELEQYASVSIYCSHNKCRRSPLYFDDPLQEGWLPPIKAGTIVGYIAIGSWRESYCRECIDDIFAVIKSNFDSKLWIFS
jgi:hypothetical protein